MKLLIYLAVWKRPEITEICFMGITRLRESGLFPIDGFAVISEESMIPLCEKYDIKYCFYKNLPLGEKLNYGLTQALKLDFDYLIGIGSDDLIKIELIEKYSTLFGVKDLIATDSILFLNSETGGCRFVKTNSFFGAGRAYSRKVVEGGIWENKINKSLDKNASFSLGKRGFLETRLKSDKPLIIDIKGPDSVWDFNSVRTLGEKYPFDLAVEGLSECEIEAIKSLRYVTA